MTDLARRARKAAIRYIDDALRSSRSLVGTSKSLSYALVFGVLLVLALAVLRRIGVWAVILGLWIIIAVIIYRYRNEMSVRRVLDALKSDDSKSADTRMREERSAE